MTELTIATPPTVRAAIRCINPDCATPHPQKQGNKFCQSCGSPILLVDRYLPLQQLGRGGFAVTYTVYDTQTQQERVLKVLTETGPKAVALFEQEAQVLASLRHPGIPQVEADSYFEIVVNHPSCRSLHCLVMEKINGHTLEEVLWQHVQGCPEARVMQWFYQAIDVLRLLHQQQIIHRDLKPANFMLRRDINQLVVIDFGGAKQHQPAQPSSTRLVSPGYSPPEQITGSLVQPASDFYALGRTLIHLLTGRYPADLEDPMTGQLQWRSHAQVNPALADLLDAMVQFDVQQRPASADVIQARLEQIMSSSLLRSAATRQAAAGRRQKNARSQVQNLLQSKIGQVAGARNPRSARGRQSPPPTMAQTIVLGAGLAQGNRSPHAQSAVLRPAAGRARPTEALWDTAWSAMLGSLGGGLGTLLGFELGYRSPLGVHVSLWLWEALRPSLPFLPLQSGAELFVFGAAGLGTALGLTLAGGFRQRRQPLQAGLMGSLGYLGGCLGLRIAALDGVLSGLIVFAEVAAVFLTLGLGLSSPRLLHVGVVAIGTTVVLVSLAAANVWFVVDFWRFLYPEMVGIGTSESSGLACLVLFSLLGATLGLCLGISRHVVVPVFRWFR